MYTFTHTIIHHSLLQHHNQNISDAFFIFFSDAFFNWESKDVSDFVAIFSSAFFFFKTHAQEFNFLGNFSFVLFF